MCWGKVASWIPALGAFFVLFPCSPSVDVGVLPILPKCSILFHFDSDNNRYWYICWHFPPKRISNSVVEAEIPLDGWIIQWKHHLTLKPLVAGANHPLGCLKLIQWMRCPFLRDQCLGHVTRSPNNAVKDCPDVINPLGWDQPCSLGHEWSVNSWSMSTTWVTWWGSGHWLCFGTRHGCGFSVDHSSDNIKKHNSLLIFLIYVYVFILLFSVPFANPDKSGISIQVCGVFVTYLRRKTLQCSDATVLPGSRTINPVRLHHHSQK